ncbi:hypothetical protein FHS90_004643 [Rufibacter quisquiliarum]|uniref:Uncharacterized protein n=1 Tax=Rufibacter quisquiliarum TaxID=1549639 RepID=A0A839GYJ2_9BACT|nr:hypothetical protein [Rufibacter quisquiliarum]
MFCRPLMLNDWLKHKRVSTFLGYFLKNRPETEAVFN